MLATSGTLTCHQTASLNTVSSLGARVGRGILSDMLMEVRQFPLSQFTYYSAGDVTLSGSIGRTHVNGNLTISGTSSTDYPVTCGKTIGFATNGVLSCKDGSGAAPYSVSASTSVDAKRVLFHTALIDNTVQKSNITITALTITQLVANPATDLGSTVKNNQKLCKACDILIYYDATANTFSANLPTSGSNTTVKNAMALYSGTLTAMLPSHKVIEFDYTKLTTACGTYKRYYIYSSDASAVVILRNAGTLNRDISIVTPLDVWSIQRSTRPPARRCLKRLPSSRAGEWWA